MIFPKIRIYTQANSNAPVVTLGADERLRSIVAAASTQDMTIAIALNNVASADLITVPQNTVLPLHFEEELVGPGTITFTNPGKYVVVTVRDQHLEP